jgi:hypothetical protein
MARSTDNAEMNHWIRRNWIAVAGSACLLSFASLWYRDSMFPGYRSGPIILAEYTFIACLSSALIAFQYGSSVRPQISRSLYRRAAIILLPLFFFSTVYELAMYQFGGFDEGLVVHAATYYSQGFKPYADFPSTMPPLFMAGIRITVALLGLKWANLALLTSTFAAVTSLWIFVALRKARVPFQWALFLTVITELSTMFVAPFWWYNNSSSVAAVLLLVSAFACLQSQDEIFPWVSLSFSLALVLTSKPNAVPTCFMVPVLFAGLPRSRWIRLSLACTSGLAIAMFICNVAHMPVGALLKSYSEAGRVRGNPFSFFGLKETNPVDSLAQTILLSVSTFFFVVFLVWFLRHGRRAWPKAAICLIAAATSFMMALMNSEIKVTDLILMLMAMALLGLNLLDGTETKPDLKGSLTGLLVVFATMSCFFGVTHLRVLNVGEGMFYEVAPTETIEGGFFSGLQAAPRLRNVMRETETALSIYPSRKVFFGPRMEFEYPVSGRAAMVGMPLIWDADYSYSSARLSGLISTIRNQDPDLMIFLKDDYTRMGVVGDYIKSSPDYERIDSFQNLTLYTRKRATHFTESR